MGVFLEGFRADHLATAIGHELDVRQTNISVSTAGALRGLHYADVPPSQAKYVTATSGLFIDFVVDLRVGSPTFGTWESVVLDTVDRRAVYLSEGLGHALACLEDGTAVYLCSEVYNVGRERAINPLDPRIGLKLPEDFEPRLSAKDAAAPTVPGRARRGPVADVRGVHLLRRLAGEPPVGRGRASRRSAWRAVSDQAAGSGTGPGARPVPAVGRVLAVCTGNVCRSPYIERRLAAMLADTDLVVSSAGTRALVGAPVEPGSVRALESVGADASGFASRQVTGAILVQADLVLAASQAHRAEVVRVKPSVLRRTFTLGELADLLRDADLEGSGGRPRPRSAVGATPRRDRLHPSWPRSGATGGRGRHPRPLRTRRGCIRQHGERDREGPARRGPGPRPPDV